MRRSKTEIYLHVVWATRLREPRLTGHLSRIAKASIRAEADDLGCDVLALNGTQDHLHLLVRLPGRFSAAYLAKQIKGVSSHHLNHALGDGESFRWQEGYGAFSISRSHLRRVTAYIDEQEKRHASGRLWPEWEETDIEV